MIFIVTDLQKLFRYRNADLWLNGLLNWQIFLLENSICERNREEYLILFRNIMKHKDNY